MSKERISLFFDTDNPDEQILFQLLKSLGNKKSKLIMTLLTSVSNTYGSSFPEKDDFIFLIKSIEYQGLPGRNTSISSIQSLAPERVVSKKVVRSPSPKKSVEIIHPDDTGITNNLNEKNVDVQENSIEIDTDTNNEEAALLSNAMGMLNNIMND